MLEHHHNNDNPHHSVSRELSLFVQLVLPTVLTNLCRTAMGLTDVSLLGHFHPLNTTSGNATQYLAAAGYTVTWLSMANTAVVQGFAAAVTVLGATAYGAGNKRLLGYYLQIALTTSTLGGLVVAGATWYAGDIMQALIGFDQNMHDLVTQFSKIMLIGYFPLVWTTCLNAWLLAQKQTTPQLITFVACVGINFGLNLVFIYGWKDMGWSGFGFVGSALATSLSRWLQFIVMAVLVYREISTHRGQTDSQQQWDVGFIPLPVSAEERRELEQHHFDWNLKRAHSAARLAVYLKQACPMALTGLLEDGQIQFIGILAGRMGTLAAATHNGIFQIFWFCSSLMWAISAATRVRISAYLGSGDAIGGQFGMRVATAVALPSAAVVAGALVVLRSQLGHVFSHDPLVLALVSKIMLLCGCGYFFLGVFYIAMATLAAQGRPHLIAVSFVVGAWLVCIPLAFYFRASHLHLGTFHMTGLFGLWTAMAVGYGVTSLLAGIFVCRSNWTQVTLDAVERAEIVGGGSCQEEVWSSSGKGAGERFEKRKGQRGRGSVVGYRYVGEEVGEQGNLFVTKKIHRHDSLLQPLI